MPMQVQMLTRPFMNSYLSKFDELSDERIDTFLSHIVGTVEYIKHGTNDHGGEFYGCNQD